MPVTVALSTRDKHEEWLQQQNPRELQDLLPPAGDPDFPYLGLIDVYGDTWFSGLQMRAVLPEIRKLRALCLGHDEMFDHLEDLAQMCAEEVHHFLVFLGD